MRRRRSFFTWRVSLFSTVVRESRSKIILVEDDPDDVFFIMRAFEKYKLRGLVTILENGEEAIDFIINGKEINGKTFDNDYKVVFLDLQLPKVDGIEVLRAIKNNPPTKHLEVIILTNSGKDPNVEISKNLGANSYIVKPIVPQEFLHVISELGHYWVDVDKY